MQSPPSPSSLSQRKSPLLQQTASSLRVPPAAAAAADEEAKQQQLEDQPQQTHIKRMSCDEYINQGIKPSKIRDITLVLACANAADAVEVLAVGFFLTVYTNKDGSELTSIQKEVLTGSIFMGMLIGGVLGGWLSDVIGRKYSLIGSLALNASAGLLSAFSPSFGWLSLFRVLAGIGVGASVPCLFTLGAELFPVHKRGVHLSYIASFWMVGSIYAAAAAWIILGDNVHGDRILPGWSWRSFVFIAALPVFITLTLVVLLLPESPRYLLNRGKYHEAAKALQNLTGNAVAAESLMAPPEIGLLESDHNGTTTEDSPTIPSISSSDNSSSSGSSSVLKGCGRMGAVFSGHLRATTLRLMLIWFSLCFGTYGLNTWISTIFKDIGVKNEFLPTFLFALANGPGNLASFVLIERIGRKRLLAYSMLLAALSAFLFAGTSAKAQWVAVTAACGFQAFSVAGWNALDALSTESFPTATRTTGMGLLSGTGRFASLMAMVINGSLEHSIALLFAVTGTMTVLGALASFWLPYEPAGMSLDGPTAAAASATMARFTTGFQPVVGAGSDGGEEEEEGRVGNREDRI